MVKSESDIMVGSWGSGVACDCEVVGIGVDGAISAGGTPRRRPGRVGSCLISQARLWPWTVGSLPGLLRWDC